MSRLKLLALFVLLSWVFVAYINYMYVDQIKESTPSWVSSLWETGPTGEDLEYALMNRFNKSLATIENYQRLLRRYFYRKRELSYISNHTSYTPASQQHKLARTTPLVEQLHAAIHITPTIYSEARLSDGPIEMDDYVSISNIAKALSGFAQHSNSSQVVDGNDTLEEELLRLIVHDQSPTSSFPFSVGKLIFRRLSPMKIVLIDKRDLRNFEIRTNTQRLRGNLFDGRILHAYIEEDGSEINEVSATHAS